MYDVYIYILIRLENVKKEEVKKSEREREREG